LARVQESLIQRSGGLTLLVMVDDGHLLDDYSALAIQQLVVAGRAQMLASVREGALASDAFEAIVGPDQSVRVPLGPLGEPDVSDLVAVQLGGPVDARLARDAWSASQGNPMVVSLLVEAGVRSAAIVQHHGLWTLTGSLAPHPRLLALIGAQLELLSPLERNAIDVIALAEPLEAAVTARLVPSGVIASLSRRRIVVGVDGEGQTRLRLVHPLFGDAARERLTEERRNSVITELAGALDLSHGSDADLLLRVAMWGSAAHCPLDPDLLLRAAAVARTRSIESAIHLLQAAMVAGAPASVALDLAHALVVAGRVSEAEAALTDFDRQGLTDAERVSGCMTRAIGLIWTLQRPEVALTLLDEERSTSGTDPLLSGLLDAAESGAHLMRGDVVSAVRAGTRALATPDIGDLATVVAAIGTTVGLVYQGRHAEATEVADRVGDAAIRLVDTAPPMVAGLRAARWEAFDYAGDLTALKAEAELALVRAVEAGDDFMLSRTNKSLARVALLAGRPRHAVRHLRQALVATHGFDRNFEAWLLAQLAEALAVAGDRHEARRSLIRSDDVGTVAVVFAADRVRAEAAVLAAEGLIAQAAKLSASGAREAMGHTMAGQALSCWYQALRFGHAGAARELSQLTEVHGVMAATCREHAAALLARDGDALDRVASQFVTLGASLFGAEAGMAAATAHQRRGLTDKATASFEQARLLLDPTDPAATPTLVSTPSVVIRLTPREREVAQLAALGLADRAIADRLRLSVRTVGTHLNRAYTKLGVQGRTGLSSVFATSPADHSDDR
jgi:DNA-binding CsgD family transcriptional regulator